MVFGVAKHNGDHIVKLVSLKPIEEKNNEKYPPSTPRISTHCLPSAR
jgi:hypothetical protein